MMNSNDAKNSHAIVFGIVNGDDCDALNVREKPDRSSASLGTAMADTEVEILEDVNEDWYKVCTAAGLEGYSMKQFIVLENS